MYGKVVIAACLLLVQLVQSSHGLKCYSCTSTILNACIDPSASNELQPSECTSDKLSEFTNEINRAFSSITSFLNNFGGSFSNTNIREPNYVCQKVEIVRGGDRFITRGCSVISISEQLCNNQGTNTLHCSYCTSDGCNGAPTPVPALPFFALLIPALGVLVFGKYFM